MRLCLSIKVLCVLASVDAFDRAAPRRLLFASTPGPSSDEFVAPASFWPATVEDLGPCEAPFDDDAVLRAARLQNALIFLGTPFQIDAWAAAHGLSFALTEMTSLLENITTPNVTQNVYETSHWVGSKFVEYQFLSSVAFNPYFHYLRRECEPDRCVFTSKLSSRTLDASVTVDFERTVPSTGATSGPPTGSSIERSVLTFESCGSRIASIHTDLPAGMQQTPDENFAENSNLVGNVLLTCSSHMLFCRGELAEYSDLDDCVARMRAKPGVCYNFVRKGDTVDCRLLHLLLARFKPTVHCPHMAETSEVCGFDDCPGGLCGYANTLTSPDFITADRWQQAECARPMPPPVSSLPCIETCADDLQGLLAAGGVTCEQMVLAGCKTPIATLDSDAGLPADVVIEELCPLACGQCAPRCDA